MKPGRVLIASLVIGCFVVSMGWSQGSVSRDKETNAYIELMRKDIRAERKSIVEQVMDLEPADKAKFWVIFDKYADETKGLWDQRLANIVKYADNQETITDKIADELATTAIKIRSQQLAIQKKYYGQMKAALGARVATRFLQIETMLGNLLDIQLGSEIPLME